MHVVFLFTVGLVAVGASVAEERAISPPASVPADRSFRGSSAGTGLAEPTKVTDLSTVVSLQAFNQDMFPCDLIIAVIPATESPSFFPFPPETTHPSAF